VNYYLLTISFASLDLARLIQQDFSESIQTFHRRPDPSYFNLLPGFWIASYFELMLP
jgi:hypothetical protein